MKACVESQFGYSPLIWMFHSRGHNKKINRINERALRITYEDKFSTLQEPLEKDNSVLITYRNIQKLDKEMYKVLNGLSPPILNDIFVLVSRPYNLRINEALQRQKKLKTENCVPHTLTKLLEILIVGTCLLDSAVYFRGL